MRSVLRLACYSIALDRREILEAQLRAVLKRRRMVNWQ